MISLFITSHGESFFLGIDRGRDTESFFEGGAEVFDVRKAGQKRGFWYSVIPTTEKSASVMKPKV